MFSPLSNQVIATWQEIGSWQIIPSRQSIIFKHRIQAVYALQEFKGIAFYLKKDTGTFKSIKNIQGWISPDQITENKRKQVYQQLYPLLSADKSSVIFSLFEKIYRKGKVVGFVENKKLCFLDLPEHGEPLYLQKIKGPRIPNYSSILNLNVNTLLSQIQNRYCCVRIKDSSLTLFSARTEIYIRTLTGKTFAIWPEMRDSVDSVKQKIKDREGIPTNQQRVVFAEKEIENWRTLANCGVQWEDTLHLVLKLTGGGPELLTFVDLNNQKKIAFFTCTLLAYGYPRVKFRRQMQQRGMYCIWSNSMDSERYRPF